MIIRKFNNLIKESKEELTLYRLVRVPKGEPLVVNFDEPGKHYFKSKNTADPSLLKNQTGDLWMMEVTTDSDNVVSEDDNVIVIEDPRMAKVQSIIPFAA